MQFEYDKNQYGFTGEENLTVSKTVLHFVSNDKFTKGYINFFLLTFEDYNNIFFIQKNDNTIDVVDCKRLYMYKDWKSLIFNKQFKQLLKMSDKIIFSGIFETFKLLLCFPKKALGKTYLQFWGGDFYGYRDVQKFSYAGIRKYLFKTRLKKVKALIMLIDDDYENISNIFTVKKKYFVAPVMTDPLEQCDYKKYINNIDNSCCKILLGNSATQTNNHMEILKQLAHLKAENIKIICPLSYGEENYRDYIISEGVQLFGDRFVPITEYLSRDSYCKLLSECSVAIFNHDRQQALGNIFMLIELKRKIYIREDISTWRYLNENGISVNSVSELQNIEFDELIFQNEENKCNNVIALDKIKSHYVEQWRNVLEDM